ncbi:MAG: hypothetical protein IT270_18310 [Saprospiraceae bacterium]|nr:hypothetical protein [Saprospiraceae bacterium]
MKTELSPKAFIEAVYINDLGKLVASDSPYLAFIVMAAGIEFLGRCISQKISWGKTGVSGEMFKIALENLESFKQYKDINKKISLYNAFRCGLLHTSKTNANISLSSKNEMPHLVEHNGRLNFHCETFFNDFKAACEEVIAMDFYNPEDKMNVGFLPVPANQNNPFWEDGSSFAISESPQCS